MTATASQHRLLLEVPVQPFGHLGQRMPHQLARGGDIPMREGVSSLNLATAVAVVVYGVTSGS